MKKTNILEKRAMNIVYQIGDFLEIDPIKRQKTNDELIDFVMKIIQEHTLDVIEKTLITAGFAGFPTSAREDVIEYVSNYYKVKTK